MAAQPRRTGREPIDWLTHPLRRRILRQLHRRTKPCGAKEMASEMGLEITFVTYHMNVLVSHGATRQIGIGSEDGKPLYESAVAEDAEVLALLEANEAADEGKGKRAA